MGRGSGIGGSTPIHGADAAWAGIANHRRLLTVVSVLGFWLFTYGLVLQEPIPDQGILVYRVDANGFVGYPRSDAAMDYLNAVAILSGDGWVNWRDINRWSVYRPGWGASLAGLALLTGGDPARMQGVLSFLLAASGPALMLLVLSLYPGRGALLLAPVAAIAWVLRPFYGWFLQKTMMSEGPTILLGLLFSLVALRSCRRLGEWSWRQGAVLGALGGALSLVREQSRFGVLAVVVLLALASLGRFRRRLPFFVGLAGALLVVVGPLYLKTSIHLRLPYAGTSFVALYNTLDYTPVGRQVGGVRVPGGVPLPERQVTRLFQQRVLEGLKLGLSRPRELLRDGFLHFSRAIHGSVTRLTRLGLPPPKKKRPVAGKLALFWGLTALGLFFSWRRTGPAALVPLVFAAGYFLPTVPFWFYSNRLGVPISWVGLVYVAGALLVLYPRRTPVAEGAGEEPAAAGRQRSEWPPRTVFVLAGGWLILATSVLLWMDHRPLAEVEVERLFTDERARRTLASAGVEAGPELIEEAGRLLDGSGDADGDSANLLAGIAVLPMTIAPGDEPVLQPFSNDRLAPAEKPYGVFYLVSPWKRGGTLRMWRVRLAGGELSGIGSGDRVLVVKSAGSQEAVGKNRVVRLDAVAVLPTRWAE